MITPIKFVFIVGYVGDWDSIDASACALTHRGRKLVSWYHPYFCMHHLPPLAFERGIETLVGSGHTCCSLYPSLMGFFCFPVSAFDLVTVGALPPFPTSLLLKAIGIPLPLVLRTVVMLFGGEGMLFPLLLDLAAGGLERPGFALAARRAACSDASSAAASRFRCSMSSRYCRQNPWSGVR